jgi:elongation factor P--beta-lysine ligase
VLRAYGGVAAAASSMKAVLDRHSVHVPGPHTPARLVNALLGEFVEPSLRAPTFLMDHPLSMSPLAKEHPDKVRGAGSTRPGPSDARRSSRGLPRGSKCL